MPQAMPRRSISPTESRSDHWRKRAAPTIMRRPGRKYCSLPRVELAVRLYWLMVIRDVSRSLRDMKFAPADNKRRSPAWSLSRPILPLRGCPSRCTPTMTAS